MKLKGKWIQPGKEGKLVKGNLYQMKSNRDIRFSDNDGADVIWVHFHIQEGQTGFYSEEFKPQFVDDEGGKKVDILALVTDENTQKFTSWLLDAKVTVGGDGMLFHLAQQLRASYLHKQALTIYLEDYEEVQHLGYITREFRQREIEHDISKMKSELKASELPPELQRLAAAKKKNPDRLKKQRKLKVLEDFLNNKIEIAGQFFPLECHIMTLQPDGTYLYNLEVSC